MRYCITLFHGSVFAHTVILDHEIYILCAGNNCIHVHDYVSVHIIIRSKFRFGTRGRAFVLTLSWAAAQSCATVAIMPLILSYHLDFWSQQHIVQRKSLFVCQIPRSLLVTEAVIMKNLVSRALAIFAVTFLLNNVHKR